MLKFLRLLAVTFLTVAIVVAAAGGGAYWLYRDAQAPGPLAGAKTLVVPAHSGLAGIADLLARDGVIRNALTFEVIAKLSGRSHELKPGEYEFPSGATTVDAFDIVASGRTVKHRLTIPEGLTSPEVVALVEAAPALDGETGPPPPEGSLFPDTYVYSYGDSRKALIARMQHAMKEIVAELWAERRADLPLAAPHDAVTLASIVEKETALPEERPHVAGVFINRLRLGMRLQADPTVLFALSHDGTTKLDRPLAHADLATDSPYNTYLVKGLPPGPIDNPGRATLRAAIQPERTDDFYFVADGNGGHIFAKTLAEQTRNVAQYRAAVAAAAAAGTAGTDAVPTLDAPPEPIPSAISVELGTAAARPAPAGPAAAPAPAAAAPKRTAEQTARLRHCRVDGSHACPHLR